MNLSDIQLNENQHAAVDWNEGPLLVLAGPGSGKTLVLTCRAARLLQDDENASILALTFTKNAAKEMRTRLDKLVGSHAENVHVCTFHSFAVDILRQHGSHVGIKPDFSILTTVEDRLLVLEEVISSLKFDTSSLPSDRKNLLFLLERLFRESYDGKSNVAGMISTPVWIPKLFCAYCDNLKLNNRLDFNGLLFFARKLLLENKGVVRLTQLAWKYICVDEFHDTNRAQYDLLCLLVNKHNPNLFVVADEDQIMYQWNGASPERLLSLKEDFGMHVLQLPENFRCPPDIIQLANNLISHNEIRSKAKKPLVARKKPSNSSVLTLSEFATNEEEVQKIPVIIKKEGWKPDDCVVLARLNNLLQEAAKALKDNGFVPYIPLRKNEFESPSVFWMNSILRLANARHDREFLRRICVSWKEFTGELIETEDVEAAATLSGEDFLRTWVDIALSKEKAKKRNGLLSKIQQDLVNKLSFIDILEYFFTQKWMDDELENEDIEIWKNFHSGLLNEHSLENITLNLYLQEMDLQSKTSIRSPDSVSCLTVHGAKGLEFKHVFLIGMADAIFPSYQAVKKGHKSSEIEEERRNCFVAITRVEETLNVSYAENYNGFSKRPSRFIEEMGLPLK
jgi:DNA helicase-2/ATP-dependent DNA helicase PcrA